MPSTWLLLQLVLGAVALVLLTIVVRRCTLARARSRQKRIEAEARLRTARGRLGLEPGFYGVGTYDRPEVIAEGIQRNEEFNQLLDEGIAMCDKGIARCVAAARSEKNR